MPLIQFVNKVWFGSGELRRLPAELKRLGVARPLALHRRRHRGRRSSGAGHGAVGHGRRHCSPRRRRTRPSAPSRRRWRSYREASCDGIVAVGGGSPIDLAKAVNLLATHAEPLAQYEAARKGQGKIGAVGPLVAIPTTAGTGTEVSVGTVIVTEDGRKSTIASPNLIPDVAICDPDLTLGLPAGLTAATGMDAVTHCIEAVLSPLYNPVADAIGLDGLERAVAGRALERAVADGAISLRAAT